MILEKLQTNNSFLRVDSRINRKNFIRTKIKVIIYFKSYFLYPNYLVYVFRNLYQSVLSHKQYNYICFYGIHPNIFFYRYCKFLSIKIPNRIFFNRYDDIRIYYYQNKILMQITINKCK